MSAQEEEYYEGDDEWEVEKLLAKRKNKETKETEYKVLWAGCTEGEEGATSWELKSWLEEEGYEDLMVSYEKEAKLAGAEKQKKAEAEAAELKAQTAQRKAEAQRKQQLENEAEYISPLAKLPDEHCTTTDTPYKYTPKVYKEPLLEALEQMRDWEADLRSRQEAAAGVAQHGGDTDEREKSKESCQDGEIGFKDVPLSEQLLRLDQRQSTAAASPIVGHLSVADEYVNTFENNFLRGNYVDPSIMRILGLAQWDIKKAWTEQQEVQARRDEEHRTQQAVKEEEERNKSRREAEEGSSEQKEAESEEAALDDTEVVVKDAASENQAPNEEDVRDGEEDYDHDDGENMFMIAPTTFFESADILLVIMSFSVSRDFFSACSVSKRWHHVGGRMRDARSFVRDFCAGLQKSFTCNAVIPLALASAGTPRSMLRKLYRQTKAELSDPKYDGKNGGALVPLYNLTVHDGNASEFKVDVTTNPHGRGGSVSSGYGLSAGGHASVLDSTTVIYGAKSSSQYNTAEAEVQTLCLSVGRLPTMNSYGRVEILKKTSGALNFNMTSHSAHYYSPGRVSDIHYCPGHTDLAVPVLYIRVAFLSGVSWRQRISNALHSQWGSELGRGIEMPKELLEEERNLKIDEERRKTLVRLKQVKATQHYDPAREYWRNQTAIKEEAEDKKEDDEGGDEPITIMTEEQVAEQESREKREAFEAKKEQVAAEEGRKVAILWNDFFMSLPPPKILWKSFAPVKAPWKNSDDEAWFVPPTVEVDGATNKKLKKTERKVLSHDEIVEKMGKATPKMMGKELTQPQREVLAKITHRFGGTAGTFWYSK